MANRARIARDERPTSRSIAKSAAWRFAEAIGSEGSALLIFIVMARLLLPEAFGVVALAGVVVAAAQVLLYAGVTDAIVQGPDAGPRRLATAFWLNLGLGLALMLLIGLGAAPLASLFAEPALAPTLIALSLILPPYAVATLLQARFQRRLAFKVVALRALLANLVGGVVGLGLALAGAGIWALVGLQLAGIATGLVVLVAAEPWRPQWRLHWAEARALARFALPVMGTHLTRFAGKKLDLALLGLFVSATELGYYFLATRLIFALGLATHYAVFSLTLPVLARLAHDGTAFRSAACRTLWLTTAFCLPAGLGLALVADLLVPLVMGAVWQPSVLPLQILAGLAIAYALALVAGQIMVAAGWPGVFLRLTVANTAVFLAVVAIAAPWGLAAAALAGSLANVLLLPAYLLALGRLVGLAPAVVLRDQLPVWLAGAGMALAVLALRAGTAGLLAPLPLLAAAILTGAAAYALALWLLAGPTLRSLARAIAVDRMPAAPNASAIA